MNNEPVALMTEYGIHPLYEGALQEGMFLYTHPAKTLTISVVDIDSLVDQFWYSDDAGFHFHYYDFAEAILRKAQENG